MINSMVQFFVATLSLLTSCNCQLVKKKIYIYILIPIDWKSTTGKRLKRKFPNSGANFCSMWIFVVVLREKREFDERKFHLRELIRNKFIFRKVYYAFTAKVCEGFFEILPLKPGYFEVKKGQHGWCWEHVPLSPSFPSTKL